MGRGFLEFMCFVKFRTLVTFEQVLVKWLAVISSLLTIKLDENVIDGFSLIYNAI